jgi:2-desacetyl-2-hydroxyethyl bacteriochlorophyllide A dehydrogenase
MKAVVLERPREAVVKDLPVPSPGPGEVVVAVKACGICGTDVHIYEGEFPPSPYPLVPGHEMAGVVAATGHGVDTVKEGDPVAVDPSLFCGRCFFCRTNRGNLCENWGAIGDTTDGGFAEYVRAPAKNAYRLPPRMSFSEGAFVEPLSCVVYALRRMPITPGDEVLIFGAGPMGLLLLQAVKHAGASTVAAVDLKPARLEVARTLGADVTATPGPALQEVVDRTIPRGFDVVIDATGSPRVVQEAFEYIRRGGRLLIFGVSPAGAPARFEPFQVYNKDLTIYGSMAVNNTFIPAIRLLESGAVRVLPILSHTLPLGQYTQALELFRSGDALKIQLSPEA